MSDIVVGQPTTDRRFDRAASQRAWLVRTIGRALVGTLLVVLALLWLAPIIWTMSTSLRTPAQSFSLPPQWLPTDLAFGNYRQVFESVPFGEILANSVKVSVAIVLGQLVTASLAGYAFARLRFPGKNLLFFLLMASLMVPGQATIIPVFLLIKWFGLADTLWSLILPAWVSAFGVFFMRQAFMQIPQDLVDAAKIDGAGQWHIFSRVFVPLCTGPMAVLAILSFNTFWNEFFRPLIFLSSQKNFTLPIGLVTLQGYLGTGSLSVVLAGVVISMLPVLLIFIFAQRYVIEGIARTGVKG
ncbi:MAG: carbohydrate ABC transporter permease [Chloroflexi bacterium]|nr:carbohydrate ABC transporter permease [Chloroflexota bacterium]